MRIISLAAVAALCLASAAIAATDGAPIKGSIVKGGQNASPPQAAQPTDTGAAPQPAENTNPNSGIGIVVKPNKRTDDSSAREIGTGVASGKADNAINTKGTGATNRMAAPGADTTADPKHPHCLLKTRTKSNQCNE